MDMKVAFSAPIVSDELWRDFRRSVMSAMALWEDEAEDCRPSEVGTLSRTQALQRLNLPRQGNCTENINLPTAFVGALQVITEP